MNNMTNSIPGLTYFTSILVSLATPTNNPSLGPGPRDEDIYKLRPNVIMINPNNKYRISFKSVLLSGSIRASKSTKNPTKITFSIVPNPTFDLINKIDRTIITSPKTCVIIPNEIPVRKNNPSCNTLQEFIPNPDSLVN